MLPSFLFLILLFTKHALMKHFGNSTFIIQHEIFFHPSLLFIMLIFSCLHFSLVSRPIVKITLWHKEEKSNPWECHTGMLHMTGFMSFTRAMWDSLTTILLGCFSSLFTLYSNIVSKLSNWVCNNNFLHLKQRSLKR